MDEKSRKVYEKRGITDTIHVLFRVSLLVNDLEIIIPDKIDCW